MATAGRASVGCSLRGGEKQVSLVLCELRVAEPPGGTEQARRAQTSSQLLQAGPGCGASHAWAWPSTRKGLEHTEQSPQPRGYPMEGTSPFPGAPGSRTCQQGAGGQREERADQERPGGGDTAVTIRDLPEESETSSRKAAAPAGGVPLADRLTREAGRRSTARSLNCHMKFYLCGKITAQSQNEGT